MGYFMSDSTKSQITKSEITKSQIILEEIFNSKNNVLFMESRTSMKMLPKKSSLFLDIGFSQLTNFHLILNRAGNSFLIVHCPICRITAHAKVLG